MLARIQTGLLVIAFLATPPDLVTRASAQAADQCHGMCRTARGARPAVGQPQTGTSREKTASCPHGIAGHFIICVGKSKQKVVYEIVAPLRPAMLSENPNLPGPQFSTQPFPAQTRSLLLGFLPAPFEPPRS